MQGVIDVAVMVCGRGTSSSSVICELEHVTATVAHNSIKVAEGRAIFLKFARNVTDTIDDIVCDSSIFSFLVK